MRKRGNIIIMVAGILSFSIAFLIIILFYCILLCYKKKYVFIGLIILFCFYFFILPNLHFHSAELNETISRLTFHNGGFIGDNRETESFKRIFSDWIQSNKIMFGYGYGYTDSWGALSIRRELVKYGIVGVLVIYGTLLCFSIKECEKNIYAWFFTIVFFISIYQRPMIFNLPYFLVLLGGIDRIKNDNISYRKKDIYSPNIQGV